MGKPKAPEAGHHRRAVAENTRLTEEMYMLSTLQQYDDKMMSKKEDMWLQHEEEAVKNGDNVVIGGTFWHIAYHSLKLSNIPPDIWCPH